MKKLQKIAALLMLVGLMGVNACNLIEEPDFNTNQVGKDKVENHDGNE
jgi:hypothetical protein